MILALPLTSQTNLQIKLRNNREVLLMKRIIVWAVFVNILAVPAVFLPFSSETYAFDSVDFVYVGAAFLTNLGLHEIGHDVVAGETGAESNKIHFFTKRKDSFFLGLSTYKTIPQKSKLPYFVGGERMVDLTFEYSLKSYHNKPTTFNKALLFFSYSDFLWYTLYSYYIKPGNYFHDPNLIRRELGWSKEQLFSFVITKALLNTYRIFNEDAKFAPIITVDKTSAIFMIKFDLW